MVSRSASPALRCLVVMWHTHMDHRSESDGGMMMMDMDMAGIYMEMEMEMYGAESCRWGRCRKRVCKYSSEGVGFLEMLSTGD